jgi:gluconate 5-dehydrogenase|tara:strand:+ start:163 stop:933 length:771 start_codon:yes stop_codon:yes gene_type:complete
MMKDLFRLDGKIAVVTGGTGGIGEALALGLSQYGAKVIIASRNLEALEAKAHEIQEKTGNETVALQIDVTDESSVSKLVDDVMARYGTIDILVNAMGLNIKRDAFDYPMDDWDLIFNINVKGTMTVCKHIGKIMKQKGQGKIINLSSVRGIRGHTGGNSAYCATKGAVEQTTKALALEWAPHNIKVNALGPALVITPGTVHIQQNPELAKTYAATIPLGRLSVPEDLIGACVYLASEASDFVTGQTIYVDGGFTVT